MSRKCRDSPEGAAEAVEEALVEEALQEAAGVEVREVPAMRMGLPARPVIYIGNLGKLPGDVVIDIHARGETTKAQNPVTIEMSLEKPN